MASNIIPMSPFSPTAKLTFLALPPEMRLEIYEKLISGPLALCWPEPECLSHMCNIQRLSSVGILRTCHQIREEATPLFYRSVYVGFSHKSPDSRLQYTQLSTRANVREAAFEYPWTHPRALNLWLGSSNAFRNLKHCKLFLDRSLPLWPPSFSALVDINAVTLEHELAEAQRKFAVTDCWPVHGLKISLTIYLSWTSRRTDPPSSSMAVRCGLKPTVHDKYYVVSTKKFIYRSCLIIAAI